MATLPKYIVFSSIYPGCVDVDANPYSHHSSLTSVSISDSDTVTVNNQVSYDYCDVGTDFFNDVLNNQTIIDEINQCITNQQNGHTPSMSIPANYAHILQQIFEAMSTSFKIVPLKFGSLTVVPNMITRPDTNDYLNLQFVMTDEVSDNVIRKAFNIRITRSGDTYSGNCDGIIEYICDVPIQ